MARQITGILLTPGGTAEAGTLRFYATGDAVPSLIENTYIEHTLTGAGAYDVTLNDGVYSVSIKMAQRFIRIGAITVTTGAAVTLPTLLTS